MLQILGAAGREALKRLDQLLKIGGAILGAITVGEKIQKQKRDQKELERLLNESKIPDRLLSVLKSSAESNNATIDDLASVVFEIQAKLKDAATADQMINALRGAGFSSQDIEASEESGAFLIRKLAEVFAKTGDQFKLDDLLRAAIGHSSSKLKAALKDAHQILEDEIKQIKSEFDQLGKDVAPILKVTLKNLREDISSESIREILEEEGEDLNLVDKSLIRLLLERKIALEQVEGATKDLARSTGELSTQTEQAEKITDDFSSLLDPEKIRQTATAAQSLQEMLGISPETLEQFRQLRGVVLETARGMQELKQAVEGMTVPALPQGFGAQEGGEGIGGGGFENLSTGVAPFAREIASAGPAIRREADAAFDSLKWMSKDTADSLNDNLKTVGGSFLQLSQTIYQGLLQLQQVGAIKGKKANKGLAIAGSVLSLISGGLNLFGQFGKVFGGGFDIGAALEQDSAEYAAGVRALGWARGGLLPGHFAAIRAFQEGAVVNRPTFGFIGEGGLPEAVVPLPDRKNIPVKLLGERDRGKPVSVSVQINGDITPRVPNMRPEDVIKVVVNDINKDGPTRRVIIDRAKR